MPIIQIESEEHWHQLRRDHIGASEIAALFGVKAFTTRHEIWTRMRGLYSATHQNDFLEFGNDMEPIVAKYLARTYGLEIVKAREYHIHPDYPWLGCTPDYYIANSEHGKAGLQIKHVSGPWVDGWSQVKAPDYIELQVQQELFIQRATLREYGYDPIDRHYIGAMIGGNVDDLRLMERQIIPNVVEEIVEKSAEFMEQVRSGEPPIDDPRDMEHLRDMFMASDEQRETIDLRDDSEKLESDIARYFEAQDQETAANRRKEAIKARLMRACMVLDKDDVIACTTGETENYEINMKIIEVHRRAQEASVDEQLRFSIRRK